MQNNVKYFVRLAGYYQDFEQGSRHANVYADFGVFIV